MEINKKKKMKARIHGDGRLAGYDWERESDVDRRQVPTKC